SLVDISSDPLRQVEAHLVLGRLDLPGERAEHGLDVLHAAGPAEVLLHRLAADHALAVDGHAGVAAAVVDLDLLARSDLVERLDRGVRELARAEDRAHPVVLRRRRHVRFLPPAQYSSLEFTKTLSCSTFVR